MRIGELAEKAGVNVQTVRYYERRNILRPSSVSASGYRLYRDADLKRLRFIKQTQELGFSLDEIEDLLGLETRSKASCSSVARKAGAKLEAVREKIRLLQHIEAALEDVISTCNTSGPRVCPFLTELS